MRGIKYLLYIFGTLFLFFNILCFIGPSKEEVERSAVVEADLNTLFDQVNEKKEILFLLKSDNDSFPTSKKHTTKADLKEKELPIKDNLEHIEIEKLESPKVVIFKVHANHLEREPKQMSIKLEGLTNNKSLVVWTIMEKYPFYQRAYHLFIDKELDLANIANRALKTVRETVEKRYQMKRPSDFIILEDFISEKHWYVSNTGWNYRSFINHMDSLEPILYDSLSSIEGIGDSALYLTFQYGKEDEHLKVHLPARDTTELEKVVVDSQKVIKAIFTGYKETIPTADLFINTYAAGQLLQIDAPGIFIQKAEEDKFHIEVFYRLVD